ncbi:MAG TPA: polysaccharide deacetylase family protein [Planococcus sp. (in: firmicutes)]|nr:polysaccharide deacetylase family protein [Planococcus sp. (in: firmicutes)]
MKKVSIWLAIVALITLFVLSRKELFVNAFSADTPAMNFPEELEAGCLALNYHRVLDDTLLVKSARSLMQSKELVQFSVLESEFQEQIDALKNAGVVFMTEENLLRAKAENAFPEKCVWISFDDIDRSVYENAFPILKEANVPFTMFVIAGHVGAKDFSNLEMASWDELREMKNSGLAEFGSHTYDMHRFEDETPVFLLPEQSEAFKKDLEKSIQKIETELDITVKSFAYPYGNSNELVTTLVEAQGLEAGYILAPQTIRPNDDTFLLNRIIVNQTTFEDVLLPYLEKR